MSQERESDEIEIMEDSSSFRLLVICRSCVDINFAASGLSHSTSHPSGTAGLTPRLFKYRSNTASAFARIPR